jgi:hypothetical protein
MQDNGIFIATAQHCGFSADGARATLDMALVMLQERGHAVRRAFYIYRSDKSEPGKVGTGARPRLVLAFVTPDTAMVFAQHHRLGPTPRLLRATLAQLLSVLLQRPAIGALMFVDEPITFAADSYLPSGLRLERDMLLKMLKGEQAHG